MSSRASGFVLGPLALLLFGAAPAGAATATLRCAATKLRVAGRAAGAQMLCYASAARAGTAIGSVCLDKARTKGETAVGAAGTSCPGTTGDFDAALASCVGALSGDVPGTGPCAATVAKASARGVRRELACQAKELTRPGTFAACERAEDLRTTAALTRAGTCAMGVVVASVLADVDACLQQLVLFVSSTTTTTTTTSTITTITTTTTTTTTVSTTTTTTTTTLPQVCCTDGTGLCLYTDSTSCTQPPPGGFGGQVGAAGTLCDASTGACVTPPPSAGPCCTLEFATGSACAAGPEIDEATCLQLIAQTGAGDGTLGIDSCGAPGTACGQAFGCCSLAFGACFYQPGAAACFGAGGQYGGDGTACDATTGACHAPPAPGDGSCCTVTDGTTAYCEAGAGMTATICTALASGIPGLVGEFGTGRCESPGMSPCVP